MRRFLARATLAATLFVSGVAGPVSAAPVHAQQTPIEDWDSSYGPVALDFNLHIGIWFNSQNPAWIGVIDKWSYDRATRILTVNYFQDWNNQTGLATLMLSEDGLGLNGTWSQQPAGTSGEWALTRTAPSLLLQQS